MKLAYHIGLSFSVSLAVYGLYRSVSMAAASLFAGIFLDLDHVLEYLREYGLRADIRFFFASFSRTLYRRLVLFLHSWELLVLLAILPFIGLGSEASIGLFIGTGHHLIADQFTNGISPAGYFLTFRIRKKFVASKIFPGKGLE